MSDTPRTDAKEKETEALGAADYGINIGGLQKHAHYGWKFARALERDPAAVTRERDEAREAYEAAKYINDQSFGSGWEDFDAATVRVLTKERGALSALVAQVRDEEAEAIRQEVERYVLTGLMACDANGNPCAEYISREQVDIVIRARIAGRKA